MATIRELSAALGAGARASKYRVTFSFPSGVAANTSLNDVDALVKSSTAPGKEIGMIEAWSQGRKLILPGDTSFDNSWTAGFYLTEDHSLRYDMIQWADACDNFQKNKHSGNLSAVLADLRIEQLDSAGNPTAVYTVHNCFPQSIGEVSYGDDSADTLAEFDVTFAYTDWVPGKKDMPEYRINKATENDTAL